MSLKAAFMLPHPPLIVSEIGKGREEDIIKTKTSYEKVTEEIFEAVADEVMNYRLLADTPVKITKADVIEILNAAY